METKKFDTLEELLKSSKESHPIRHWVDDTLFKNVDGISGYRVSYALTHPRKVVENWLYELKWAWQRVFRGWDDRVIFAIDQYLADMIPVWVKVLRDDGNGGCPSMPSFTDDDYEDGTYDLKDESHERMVCEYSEVLDKIILGFSVYEKMNDHYPKTSPEYIKLNKEFKEGFNLFQEYFDTLWD